MRKVVFIIIAVVAVGIVAFFGWREFRVPNINFVTDRAISARENSFRVERLYATEIDHDAYEAELEKMLVLTEYDEEMRFQAAIAAGKPAFFPSFELVASTMPSPLEGDDDLEVWLDGHVRINVAEGQTEGRFKLGEASIEAVAQGDLALKRVEVFAPPGAGADPLPLISTDTQAAVNITDQTSFRIVMTGNTGMLTLQFVYNVDVETPLVMTALEECVLQIHVMVTVNEFGGLETTFEAEDYSVLEQLLEG
ncbi:MAG: hypothetical protein FWG45_03070 [Oscillospiraceae bacterium]|nr:hypothetical protein [Oscillospiraceae bacterium]